MVVNQGGRCHTRRGHSRKSLEGHPMPKRLRDLHAAGMSDAELPRCLGRCGPQTRPGHPRLWSRGQMHGPQQIKLCNVIKLEEEEQHKQAANQLRIILVLEQIFRPEQNSSLGPGRNRPVSPGAHGRPFGGRSGLEKKAWVEFSRRAVRSEKWKWTQPVAALSRALICPNYSQCNC